MFTNSFKLQAACRDSRGWSQHSCRRISECWCHGDREWAPGARLSGAGVQILWWCTRWIHEVSCGHRETKQRARAITGHRSTCTSVAAGNCIWGVTPRSCIWLHELSLFHFHFFLVTSDISPQLLSHATGLASQILAIISAINLAMDHKWSIPMASFCLWHIKIWAQLHIT